MIDLKKHKLVETKKNPREHTWRALEEILAYDVLNDKTLVCSSDKNMHLRKIYNDAKLQAIRDSSLKMKLSNYNALSSQTALLARPKLENSLSVVFFKYMMNNN